VQPARNCEFFVSTYIGTDLVILYIYIYKKVNAQVHEDHLQKSQPRQIEHGNVLALCPEHSSIPYKDRNLHASII
jgi:hypothetical protein